MLWFTILATFLLVPALNAAQLKLKSLSVGSTTYSNVTVLGANVSDLYFTHAHGIANVKLKYLSDELKKRFSYDPKAAAEAEEKQAQSDSDYHDALAGGGTGQSERSATNGKPLSSETNIADPVSDRSLLGKPAPPLEFDKWLTDKPTLEGKFVLVSFWASWSIPSRRCIPDLNALQKKFPEKLAVIAVTSESEADLERSSDPGITFASALDAKAKWSSLVDVTSIPCAVLVDPKGVVRYQGHPGALTEVRLERIISKPQ